MSFAERDEEEPTPRQTGEVAEDRSKKQMVWSKVWRFTVGGLIIVAGCLLSVPGVPGPGALIIIAGLAIIAPEWEPAERLLHWMRRKFDKVMDRAKAARHRNDGDGPDQEK